MFWWVSLPRIVALISAQWATNGLNSAIKVWNRIQICGMTQNGKNM